MPGYAVDDTSQYTGKNNVNYIDSAAAWEEKEGRLTVFVINRNEKETYPLDLDVRGFEGFNKISHYDWKAPAINKNAALENGLASTKVKPLSWNVLIFEK